MGPAAISTFTTAELHSIMMAESQAGILPDELPIQIQIRREKALDSAAYLATEIIDPWYGDHFEPIHYKLMDEVLCPYLIGETVTIEGQAYDPRDYSGLLVLFSRGTLKSTCLRMAGQWVALYRKLRLGEDARTMFVHQVLDKAIEHSISVKNCALLNPAWRETFPEFKGQINREWDTRGKWRWPNFSSHGATEYSWTSYGESSSKIGGHYTERLIDDWVTDESVTTDQQLEQSWDRFRAMDNLRDRTRGYNPWCAVGTNYHFQDAYKRLEKQGGWIVWKMPGHTGSPKRIFEIASIDDRTPQGARKRRLAIKKLEENPPGNLNFPTILPWQELVRSAHIEGPREYTCQILLDPVPEGEQRFDTEAIDAGWVEAPPSPSEMWCYLRIDPAISEKKDADETAIVLGGVKWDGHRYMLDGWVGREKRPVEIVRKAFDLVAKWQNLNYVVKNIGIESVAYQEALAAICRSGVPVRDPVKDGEAVPIRLKPCPIRSIKRSPDMRKHERILEMDGPVSRRELHWYIKNPISMRMVTQFKNFPYDRYDILDAVHDFWVDAYPPPRSGVTETPNMPIEFKKALERMRARKGSTSGTNNTSNLTSWG